MSTATLLGSALLTLALGLVSHRVTRRVALLGACLLMAGTGLGFAVIEELWPLLVVAFVGTLNPSGGDVSVFLPLEHTVLAQTASAAERTPVFARYAFVGSVVGAAGTLVAGTVDWLQAQAGGGLSAGAARELADLADVLIGGADLPKARRVSIKPGARLVRERGGEMHEVLVIEDGFVWRDRTWKSLSVIAREMTGTRWSGPRFFGLDRAGGAGRAGIAVEGADA